MLRMGCDIAKKREDYVPKKPMKVETPNKEAEPDVIDITAIAKKAASAAREEMDDLVEMDRKAQELRAGMKKGIEAVKPPKKGKAAKTPSKSGKKAVKKRKNNQQPGEEKTEDVESPNKKPKVGDEDEVTVLRAGMKVNGKWCGEVGYGTWYDGTIVSVDDKRKTIHIKYDDGDEDKKLSWNDVSIQ